LPYVPQGYFAQFSFVLFHQFLCIKHTGDNPSDMEHIGDKDAAIAERIRVLLAAANSTAAAVVTPSPSSATPPVPIPRDPRRLDPGADPAKVVANLTAAGIQLAVSKTILFIVFFRVLFYCLLGLMSLFFIETCSESKIRNKSGFTVVETRQIFIFIWGGIPEPKPL
jgi:hypothetical protein